MNQTLSDLRLQLGSGYRLHIDAEPHRRKRPVITTVRWACGCTADGTHLSSLALQWCRAHGPAPVRSPHRFRVGAIPLLGALLTRSCAVRTSGTDCAR